MQRTLSKSGYTLIELLIVVTLSGMLLITAIAIFFTTLQGGGKTAATEYTKQAGQYAVTQISFMIRNAKRLDLTRSTPPNCAAAMSALAIVGQDGETTVIKAGSGTESNRIASASGTTTPVVQYLTPADLRFSTGGGLVFDCVPSTYATAAWDGRPPTIAIRFSLQKGDTSTDLARDIVQIPFETSVTLRNF